MELGIPHELWDKPSAEITHLKTQCETLLEDYEESIEEWYSTLQPKYQLQHYLCRMKILPKKEQQCLNEKGEMGTKNEL